MNATQLTAWQVACDGLRTAGVDEETLARMARAADGRIEDALMLRAFGHKVPIDAEGRCVACRARLGGENQNHKDSCAWARENALKWADAGFTASQLRAALSPAEKPQGASVSRPEVVTRERALDAIFRMSNWQHGYGQGRLATTEDCVRCLDFNGHDRQPQPSVCTDCHVHPCACDDVLTMEQRTGDRFGVTDLYTHQRTDGTLCDYVTRGVCRKCGWTGTPPAPIAPHEPTGISSRPPHEG